MNLVDVVSQGESLLRSRAFGEAKTLVQAFLAGNPRAPAVLRLLAAIVETEGNFDEAARLYSEIATAVPADETALDGLIRVSHRRGDWQRLADSLLARLHLAPGRAELWNDLGAAFERLGRVPDAEAAYRRAAAVMPGLAQAMLNHASLAYRLSRYDRALQLSQRACALGISTGDAYVIAGHAKQQRGGAAAAAGQAYKRALCLAPATVPAWQGLANLSRTHARHGTVLVLMARAVSIAPEDPASLAGLAEAHRTLENSGLACQLSRRAVALAPDSAVAANTLALTQADLAQDEDALSGARRAVHLDPARPDLHVNLGVALKTLCHFTVAEKAIRQGLKDLPDSALGHMSLAMTLLALGRVEEGWREYEWRHAGGSSRHDLFPAKPWDGQPMHRGKLLVWGEQGLGDEIISGSMLPDLSAKGVRAIVECDGRLVSIFARSIPNIEFVARTDPPDPRLSADDVVAQIAMGDLARHLRRGVSDFSSPADYLKPSIERVNHWRQLLAELGPGPKIGFAWRSSRTDAVAYRDHAPVLDWAPVLQQKGASFVSLQYGEAEPDLRKVESALGVHVHTFPTLDLMNDLEGVLALSAALDLTIASPTTAFCLPAAAGTPVWLLVQENTFWLLGTKRFPWFPSIRAYIHNPAFPRPVAIRQMAGDLAAWASDRRVASGHPS